MFFILDNFLPFYSPNSSKMKISEKWKKKTLEMSFYTSVPKLMIICFTVPEIWCVTDVVVFFFILGDIFPFYPLTAHKMKISKKWKKSWRYHFTKCTKNHDHMLHCSWNMACDTCNFYFSFWVIFYPFYPPTSPQNQNFKKSEKRPGNIIILPICTNYYD